jgi:DNA-binding NtrC family response regulator
VGDSRRAAELHAAAVDDYRRGLELESDLALDERVSLRLRLADSLRRLSRYEESREALLPLLSEDVQPDLDDLSRARVLARVGWAEFFLDGLESCLQLCGRATDLLLETPFHDDFAETLRWLGYAHLRAGDLPAARERFRDALAASRRGRDLSQRAWCLEAIGHVEELQGRYAEAIAFHQECRAIHVSSGSRTQVGVADLHLGLSHMYLGELPEAAKCFDVALKIFKEVSFDRGVMLVGISLSRLYRRRGDGDRALQCADECFEIASRTSYARGRVLACEELADCALGSGDADRAVSNYEQALDQARAIAPRGDLVYELCWRLARAVLAAGDAVRAESLAAEAVELARASFDRRELGHGLATLALARNERGYPEEAAERIEEALDEFRAIRTPFELAQTHEIAADLLAAAGRPAATSLGHLLEANRLYGKLGLSDGTHGLRDRIRLLEARRSPVQETDPAPTTLLTASSAMRRLVETARHLAPDDATVLIEGETGTGKELVARIIHDSSPRADRPFVAVNCAAFPQHLLESELFGHCRGAFTGADREQTGVLRGAKNGTVLLDEIDKSSPDFQAKLLRAIEDRVIRPVGSAETLPMECRILCASNRDLRRMAEEGTFLQDLFFRMGGFRLSLPALRERPEDIPLLARHFLEPCSDRFDAPPYSISAEAERLLAGYGWPGNVRELKNAVEAAAFYARESGIIAPPHLAQEIRHPSVPVSLDRSLTGRIEAVERREIVSALEQARGVKAEAARMLGVSRKGLRDRLRRLGLE